MTEDKKALKSVKAQAKESAAVVTSEVKETAVETDASAPSAPVSEWLAHSYRALRVPRRMLKGALNGQNLDRNYTEAELRELLTQYVSRSV